MPGKLCFLVCQNLRPEVEAALDLGANPDAEVREFPAACGRPPLTWERLKPPVELDWDTVHLLGSVCLARLEIPKELQGRVHPHCRETCFQFVADRAALDTWLREGAYFVTPGWLARWREHLEERWKLGPDTARECFRECARKLVLLDTGVEPRSVERLQEMAAYVGLPAESVPVGLDGLRTWLKSLLLEWRLDQERRSARAARRAAAGRTAEYAMALTLVGDLSAQHTEAGVAQGLVRMFQNLSSPARATLTCLDGDQATLTVSLPGRGEADLAGFNQSRPAEQAGGWTEDEQGLWLRLNYADRTLAVLRLEGLAFPEHKEHYLNLALGLAGVCALALHNARVFERLQQSLGRLEHEVQERRQAEVERERLIAELKQALAEVKSLEAIIPICSGCKKIRDDTGYWNQLEAYFAKHSGARFTHGLCPECVRRYFPEVQED